MELDQKDYSVMPILYTTNKSGKELVWKIWRVDNVIFKTWGAGKLREPTRRIILANTQRTSKEQAMQVMKKDWVKKVKSGYRPKCEEGKTFLRQQCSSTPSLDRRVKKEVLKIFPMLATKFEEKEKCFKYFNFDNGVYVQTKLDGWRAVAQVSGENVVITTRTGKVFPWFSHIKKEIKTLLKNHPNVILDGEMYTEHMTDEDGNHVPLDKNFQVISQTCGVRRKNPHPLESQIQFYIFDIVDLENRMDQDERFELLKYIFEEYDGDVCQMCETITVNFWEEAKEYHDKILQRGFEGIVLRDRALMYRQKYRANKMRKYKNFISEEFMIVGAKESSGTEKGCVIWKCVHNDKTFDVRPKGTIEERRELFSNYVEYLGSLLTVTFQCLTGDGVPRFPVGNCLPRTEFKEEITDE